jgi:hypothetical protein
VENVTNSDLAQQQTAFGHSNTVPHQIYSQQGGSWFDLSQKQMRLSISTAISSNLRQASPPVQDPNRQEVPCERIMRGNNHSNTSDCQSYWSRVSHGVAPGNQVTITNCRGCKLNCAWLAIAIECSHGIDNSQFKKLHLRSLRSNRQQ